MGFPTPAGGEAVADAEIRGVADDGVAAFDAGDFVEHGERAAKCCQGGAAVADDVLERQVAGGAARLVVVQQAAVAGAMLVLPGAEERQVGPGDELWQRPEDDPVELPGADVDHAVGAAAEDVRLEIEVGDVFQQGMR